jgi:hypothetical protein
MEENTPYHSSLDFVGLFGWATAVPQSEMSMSGISLLRILKRGF